MIIADWWSDYCTYGRMYSEIHARWFVVVFVLVAADDDADDDDAAAVDAAAVDAAAVDAAAVDAAAEVTDDHDNNNDVDDSFYYTHIYNGSTMMDSNSSSSSTAVNRSNNGNRNLSILLPLPFLSVPLLPSLSIPTRCCLQSSCSCVDAM